MKSILVKYFKTVATLDLRALAVFRISLGILIICDLYNRGIDLAEHYTDAGVFPLDAYFTPLFKGSWRSLHALSGAYAFQALLFFIAFIFAMMMILGFQTRVATIASWIFLISLQNRNSMVLQGSDVLFRQLMFWGMFLPLGSKLSFDRALSPKAKNPSTISSVASFSLPLQISMMYLFAALFKNNPIWFQGLAVRDALLFDQFTKPLGYLILEYPLICTILTYVTLGIEYLAAFLILFPYKNYILRGVAIVLLLGMHLGFFATMHLGLFPWICMAGLVSLMPEKFMDLWSSVKRRKAAVTIYYDGECGFCRRSCLLIKEFLGVHGEILPGQSDPKILQLMNEHRSWVVTDAAGNHSFAYDAWVRLMKSSWCRVLAPVFNIALARWMGGGGYIEWWHPIGCVHRNGLVS